MGHMGRGDICRHMDDRTCYGFVRPKKGYVAYIGYGCISEMHFPLKKSEMQFDVVWLGCIALVVLLFGCTMYYSAALFMYLFGC